MQSLFDPELMTAGVYLVIVLLYGLLWHGHTRHAYAALAIAALILAICASLRSDTVRTRELLHYRHPAPPAPSRHVLIAQCTNELASFEISGGDITDGGFGRRIYSE